MGQAELMTPEQRNFLSQILSGSTGSQASGALGNLLQGYNEDFFQKSVIDPSLRTYQRDILPAIGQQFISADAGSSSALNQALAKSAEELSQTLAGQRLGLQQMAGQQQLGGLGILGSVLGQRSFQPIVQDAQPGILGDIIKALGGFGGNLIGRGF